MTPITDIFVGGAGDRLFKCAKSYVDVFAAAHPARHVIYLPQGRRTQLRQILRDYPNEVDINVIGHSWGAADVAWAVDQSDPDQTFNAVIGIDPVGKLGWHRSQFAGRANTIMTVHATGSEGRLMDGNITARLGRIFGQPCPPLFSKAGAVVIDAPFAHYDMSRMMRHVGDNEVSAEDVLLDRT